MMRLLRALLLAFVLAGAHASAHEIRPAYLQIDQQPGGALVVWKQPTAGEIGLRLRPHLSNGWLEVEPAERYAAGAYMISTWRVKSDGRLRGARIDIEGLDKSLTDVLVRVNVVDQPPFHAVLRPVDPQVTIPGEGPAPTRLEYLYLGIHHILSGYDHLLFVLGLLLIVPGWRALAVTITSFTLAHSITLGLATVTRVDFGGPLLETLIALSILFLGAEVMRRARGGDSLSLRRPWIVAFAFGLLHGCGFATALTALELPRADLAQALLLFNAGVEIGQLCFVAAVLALWYAAGRLRWRPPPAWHAVPAYLVGGLGAFWALQNAATLFGVPA